MLIDNPIWFREQRARVARSKRVALWRRFSAWGGLPAIWVAPLVLAVIFARGPYTHLDDLVFGCAMVSVYLQILYVSVRSVVVGAAAIARERDLQTWETLLSTPIGVGRLLNGKYLAVVIPLLLEVASVAPFLLFFLYKTRYSGMADDRAPLIIEVLMLNVACVLFFSALGMLVSACSPTTTRAATRGVLLSALVLFGTWFFDLIISSGPFLSVLNPCVALTGFLCGTSHGRMPDATLGIASVALYLGLTFVLLCMARSRLRMESIR